MAIVPIMTGSLYDYTSASLTSNPSAQAFYNALSSGSVDGLARPDYPAMFSHFTASNSLSASTGMISVVPASYFSYVTGATALTRPDYPSEFNMSYYTNQLAGWQYVMMTGTYNTGGGTVVVGSTVSYKMRGWRPTTGAYEYWVTTTPDAPPPSGNYLVDITIEQVLR